MACIEKHPGQAILIGVKRWQTPAEMLEKIHEKLAPRVHARKEVLVSNMINGVHDWTAWLEPMWSGHALS